MTPNETGIAQREAQIKNSAEYQRAVAEFVDREVYANVSGIVSRMATLECNTDDYNGPASALQQSAPDYESAAEDKSWNIGPDSRWWKLGVEETYGSAEECCDDQGIEPYYAEIYEHWIVSEQLGQALILRGETVDLDFYGSTVWGRQTTGQAIHLDGVITDIYDQIQQDRKDLLNSNVERGYANIVKMEAEV